LFMKSLRLPLFLLALPLLSLAQPPRLIIDDRTQVHVRLAWNLSWADARVGDRIPMEVLQDVLVKSRVDGKNYLVITRGEITVGTVTGIEPDRRWGRGDTMAVTLGSVKLADGESIALHPLGREPYFLVMNIRERTIYPVGTDWAIGTFGEADVDPGRFDVR
jgi:hypothetical protein